MASPNLELYNAADDTEITAINYGTGNAGDILPDAAGTEYHLWNDKGAVLGSDPAVAIRIKAKDSDGQQVDPVTVAKWVEIKSTTIHAGDDGGDITDYDDDDMSDFQPVGKDAFVLIGNIPSDCYRKIFVRVNIPTSAEQSAVTFDLLAVPQVVAAAIPNYITDIHGNGVIPVYDNIEVTDNAADDSVVDIAKGIALINDIEVLVYAQTKTLPTDAGTYKVYVTQSGVISYTTDSIPTNSIELARVVIDSSVVDSVTDKRVFIGNVRAGLDAAKTATPNVGNIYVATDTNKVYYCFTADTWTAVYKKTVQVADFQDLLAANTDHIHAAITGTGAENEVTTEITNPDVPRNVTITTTNNDTPSGDVIIEGLVRGESDTETITISAGGTAVGNKAFDTITKITIPATVSASDEVEVGIGDKLGLPKEISATSDVYKKKVNNEDKTSELSGNVDATYGTVDCSTIVANEETTIWYLAY